MKTFFIYIALFILGDLNGQSQLENLVKDHLTTCSGGTELSIGFITKGETTFHGFNIDDNHSISKCANADAIFQIGSITKVFTATLLADAIGTQFIDTSFSLHNYVNWLNADYPIKFQDLANHTSGFTKLPSNLVIEEFKDPYKGYKQQDLVALLKHLDNENLSNAGIYQYSNLGYGVLGMMLETIYGQSYAQMLKEKIFSKYNMIDSYCEYLPNEKLVDNRMFPAWNMGALVAAGGIFSTTSDLCNFIKAQFDSSNIELTMTQQPTHIVNDGLSIGLAWHISKINDTIIHWHNGATGGYSAIVLMDLKAKNGLVILSNQSIFDNNSNRIDDLGFSLFNLLTN